MLEVIEVLIVIMVEQDDVIDLEHVHALTEAEEYHFERALEGN